MAISWLLGRLPFPNSVFAHRITFSSAPQFRTSFWVMGWCHLARLWSCCWWAWLWHLWAGYDALAKWKSLVDEFNVCFFHFFPSFSIRSWEDGSNYSPTVCHSELRWFTKRDSKPGGSNTSQIHVKLVVHCEIISIINIHIYTYTYIYIYIYIPWKSRDSKRTSSWKSVESGSKRNVHVKSSWYTFWGPGPQKERCYKHPVDVPFEVPDLKRNVAINILLMYLLRSQTSKETWL